MIIFKTIVVTLFGQDKSDVANISLFFRVNYYLDEELRQKIGGEKFDSLCYWLNYGKLGGQKLESPC